MVTTVRDFTAGLLRSSGRAYAAAAVAAMRVIHPEAVAQGRKWDAFTTRLGDRGFGDLWKQIRALYDREGVGEMVSGVVAGILQKTPSIRDFLDNRLKRFVDAYDAIINGKTGDLGLGEEALRRIAFLRSIHHESWRAPAIRFLAEHPYDRDSADRFFWALDRLAYAMQYSVKDRDYRHKRYRRLLDAMDAKAPLFDEGSPLQLSARERADFVDRLR